jgi:predicted nucleotidyltransferase component of viral defense system
MFHLFTVENNTYSLLKEIFYINDISGHFALAGGTALALQIGHRYSIDLDIFSPNAFSTDATNQQLYSIFGIEYEMLALKKNMLFANIHKVKCDFVFEPSKIIRPFNYLENIRLYSIEDICAMKMHTICGRGKKKDFFDMYSLIKIYGWEQMLVWFEEKYGNTQFYYLWKSIYYFEDAEDNPEIIGFTPFDVSWDEIKQLILKVCK